jgi:RNA polymerase sigma-70 factor, ECF subfamily
VSSLAFEIEDLVQETLIAIHNQRHTYDVQRPFTAWCFAIAKYKLIDLLRRRGRHLGQTVGLDDEDELAGPDDLDPGDARRDVLRLLEQLPDRQRLPIVLVKIEGRSVVEAAQATGMSEASVKIGVHRGLKALAALIGRQP